jgi:hypothetical protein
MPRAVSELYPKFTYREILKRYDSNEPLRAWSRCRDKGKSTLHHVIFHEMVFHLLELEPLTSNLCLRVFAAKILAMLTPDLAID